MSARIRLRGDYDIWRREELRKALQLADGSADVTIDLTETRLMDAGAVALLVALQRRVHDTNPRSSVILLNAPSIVKRVLSLCGVVDLFVFASER